MAEGFFFPSANPNVDMETRRKIALAMMARNKKFPTNLGEGIASIGQEIGDALAMRALLEETAASNIAGDKALEKYTGGRQAEPATYAPPENVPPAVAAINAAAPQGPPIVPAPPPQARTIVPPTAPSGGAAPVAAGPGGMVEPGDFNEIDAADPRNRYRAPPAYLAPALERNIVDPERRGYLGQLASKEAQSPGEVSSTGAAGPFQFTRGTGAQYGIPGNARFDPDASTRAVNAFTDDNVRALTAKLGREPTPGEMALAHQQGAGTAGNMLTGQGNASASNLAVNNVPPGAGPQAAASKIMGYYGMPGATGVPASPRDAVAAAVTAQQGDGRPSVADYGQRLALAATPQQAIPAAPPAAPVRAAPPQQVAQAQQEYPPGYVMKDTPKREPPPTMTPVQQSILRDIQNTPPANREAVQKALKPLYEQEQAKITQAHEAYKDQLIQDRALKLEQEKQKAASAKNIVEVAKEQEAVIEARSKNEIRRQFGNMDPEQTFKIVGESAKVASSAAKSLAASQQAIAALNAGAIVGAGAEARLDIAKFLHNMGLPDKGNVIANTETFRGAMQPVVASIMHQTSGTSQLSEGELKFAAKAAAGDITLDANSIRQLTTIIDKASRGIITDHQRKVDVLFGDSPQAKALYGVEAPKPPAPSAGTPDGTTATGPNGAKMIRRNGRWEPM